jgi:hypothetical protein
VSLPSYYKTPKQPQSIRQYLLIVSYSVNISAMISLSNWRTLERKVFGNIFITCHTYTFRLSVFSLQCLLGFVSLAPLVVTKKNTEDLIP